jgi:hypothetical protein
MKTAAQIANHPTARLHQEIVARLRVFGSIEGARLAWAGFRENRRLWKRIVTYGLSNPERQAKLNRIAFPETNFDAVEAALKAGNNLNRIDELACGRASLAIAADGRPKIGAKGLKIVNWSRDR